jgi:plasmid stabilization system protein ParE
MKNVIHKRAVARRDLVEIYVRYAREAGVGVADCFYAEAEAAFRHLASMPGMGTLFKATNPAFGELRYLPLSSRFKKYLVFYRRACGAWSSRHLRHSVGGIRHRG